MGESHAIQYMISILIMVLRKACQIGGIELTLEKALFDLQSRLVPAPETTMRQSIQNRRAEDEVIARGLRSAEDAARSGRYHDAALAVQAELQRRLDRQKNALLK